MYVYILQVKSYDQSKEAERKEPTVTKEEEKGKTNIVICVCFYQS